MKTTLRCSTNKSSKNHPVLRLYLGAVLLLNTGWALGYGSMMGGGMMRGGMMGGGMKGGSSTTPQASTNDDSQATDTAQTGAKDAGATLFRRDCSQCHALPSPSAHKANQWPYVVERMRAHLRQYGGRDLSDDEAQSIEGYLKNHAQH